MFNKLKLKTGLKKSSTKISMNLSGVFGKKIDEEVLEELSDALIMSDMGVEFAKSLTEKLRKNAKKDTDLKQFLIDEMTKVLTPVAKDLVIDFTKKPFVLLMAGVNGTGKTTSIGKIASKYKNKKIGLVAADTFRAGAVKQLKTWADRTGAVFYSGQEDSDSAALCYQSYEKAKKDGLDLLIIDTAGRLHNNKNLMLELEKVVRVLKKQDETLPHATLLSLDATTGQNGLHQVEEFNKCITLDGLILTKLDGTAKGGIVLNIADTYPDLPINFIGIGEGIDDLQSFDAKDFAGDLLSN